MEEVLVINSGSSSLKFALFGHDAVATPEDFHPRYRGHFSGLGERPRFVVQDGEGNARVEELPDDTASGDGFGHEAALHALLDWVEQRPDARRIAAVGHRIVHGGEAYRTPVRLDGRVLDDLERLIPLAPLHQPHGLAPARALSDLRPHLPQVACFDTAFHRHQPRQAQSFALPRRFTERGVIRYGFHGLSYEYIGHVLPARLGTPRSGRTVVAHLGNGASLCALQDGRSVASTMGFTALDGLPMGTRCGNIDPGVVLHLIAQEGMTPEEVTHLLYKESGLLGVSGISGDMRTLLESNAPEAREAVDLFIYRIVREIGSLAAALGGLDHLVFTAGIGERAAPVRARVAEGCAWLGMAIDQARNTAHEQRISTQDSAVDVWVLPTDEERMIAWHTARLCR
ncbi:acetate/propionate family kinase [Ectothiorhodospira mobilis]|uniref:acetate/propionate family kinase n=1 Tax=Ectothiorhodospira mobilis TaxID=195064 RepID=UPI001EE94D48|nr:acetate/propionate family kinase [Ectothiorhodospira mobilis]MCG5536133.1 acetate/propionate family kinase [Ectothiorhodospira mobilis]